MSQSQQVKAVTAHVLLLYEQNESHLRDNSYVECGNLTP